MHNPLLTHLLKSIFLSLVCFWTNNLFSQQGESTSEYSACPITFNIHLYVDPVDSIKSSSIFFVQESSGSECNVELVCVGSNFLDYKLVVLATDQVEIIQIQIKNNFSIHLLLDLRSLVGIDCDANVYLPLSAINLEEDFYAIFVFSETNDPHKLEWKGRKVRKSRFIKYENTSTH